ncbi:hypothetical protein ACFE04_021410 [Oxalis oulophora]
MSRMTIIECFKLSCTEELRPNVKSGHSFIHDPKEKPRQIAKLSSGSRQQRIKMFVCLRSFQLTQKASKMEYKSIENVLQTINPQIGEYNVALSLAILSRFDLVYVMIDDPDDQTDYHIAHHIVRVHQKHEEALALAFTRKLLVDSYVALRRGDTTLGSRVAYRMTVRQFEVLILLSEGIARSHLDIQFDEEIHGIGDNDGGDDGNTQGDAQTNNSEAAPATENEERRGSSHSGSLLTSGSLTTPCSNFTVPQSRGKWFSGRGR